MSDLKIPSDLEQMFEDSKLDTTMFVGSDIRTLIMRVAKAEQWAVHLNAELDKGDSWAWIRQKFEKCRTQFKWYTPRTDGLIGTRYEVMGWLHVLFAHADPKVYMDITIEHQKKADDAEAESHRRGVEIIHWTEIAGAHLCRAENAERENNKLKEEIEQWKSWGVIEIAVRNPNVASYMQHWEGRATKAEEENAELKGIIAGLQDVAAGRVRPFTDIHNELESK